MSDSKTPEKPSVEKQVESPTTARPIDFDDDQQETGIVGTDSTDTPTKPPRSSSLKPDRNVHFGEGDEAPPPKPPRPNSPNTENMNTLKEAFPDVDPKVIHAVLIASSGQVEPAFNALLAMSDPNFKEEVPPPQPPRPRQTRQEQQDELYARQLAEHYRSQTHQPPPGGPRPRGREAGRQPGNEEREYSFFDDDLPEIREQISKGFRDTQNTINKWVSNFRKTIDGEDSDEDDPRVGASSGPERQNFGPRRSDQLRGIQRDADRMRSSSGRRSTDRERYDADPRVLSDNFNELELHDAEAEERPPPKPARPLANPDLFKPTPALPAGPVDEVDGLYEQPTPSNKSAATPNPPSTGKSKKWQPLTSVAPAPADSEADADADDDPFKLNSDDEEDDKSKKEDQRKEDSDRLKAAAAETLQKSESQDEAADEGKKELSEHERTGGVGTRDKVAEELVKGDS